MGKGTGKKKDGGKKNDIKNASYVCILASP